MNYCQLISPKKEGETSNEEQKEGDTSNAEKKEGETSNEENKVGETPEVQSECPFPLTRVEWVV